ncbi:MAG: DUF3090 family protein [Dehalococcoidia bacterium]|nr:DUF3090 family protein [Dehalococcoidia bacterium]
MTEAQHEMGRVSSLKAEAIGQPGSRRFRLVAEARNGGLAVLWLGKEQLFNLGVAIKRIIATVEERGRARARSNAPSGSLADASSGAGSLVEFQVGKMAIGYDDGTALYIIAGYDTESEEDAIPEVSLVATSDQIDSLADEAFVVCAAGRPPCPLCGAPMGAEPHVCPRHNGHKMPEA